MWNRIKYGMQRFAEGRYGTDRLNACLLGLGIVLAIVGTILKLGILVTLAYIPIIFSLFRSFSRNVEKRRAESDWFENLFTRLKDRQNRYYSCPKCRQIVRVPRGKGRISIRCPRCSERFIKKT